MGPASNQNPTVVIIGYSDYLVERNTLDLNISLTSYFGFFPAIYLIPNHLMILISNNLLNLRLPITCSPIQGSNVRRWSLITNHHTPSTLKQLHPASSLLLEVRSRRYTIEEAKQFHSYVVKLGSASNIYFVNSLIHVYVINGDLDDARKLFDGMLHRDVVSWTTLVDGYCKFGKMFHAQELFHLMPERNIVSWNVLLSGYGKYGGDVEAARRIFNEMPERDTVSWNSLISSYARNGFAKEAFELFRDALVQDAVKPNRVTLLSVLPAIAEYGYSFWGKCVHCIIIKAGIEVDGVLCSALVDMYSKCDCLDMAFQEFKSIPSRGNVASWNPMLAGLVRNNMFEEALDLFRTMQLENIEPDDVTLVSVLPAISYLGALSLGKWIHSYIRKNNFRINAALGSALVDMYSKCGCIDLALPVFAAVEEKSIELWNAMIQGLGTHGRGKDALRLFSQMQEKKLEFDDVTFAAVLNACSHSGLVDEGLSFFAAMKDIHKRTPNIQHYGCMVDLLGRAGRLEEAKDLICNKMAIKPDVVIWKSLLGACKIHGNVEIGEFAARNLSELHPADSSSYVLMSSLYEAAGRSNDAIATRKNMRDEGVKKEPGFSQIESRGMVHKFLVGDKSHPRAKEIYTMLDEMVSKAKKVGYIPNKKLVLFDITDEEKESAVSHHGEKLAVAFGLIDSDHGAPFRIVKNLRMCSDCHVFLKLVSKIYDREIVVRDHSRFHHFMNGNCSCMDYW